MTIPYYMSLDPATYINISFTSCAATRDSKSIGDTTSGPVDVDLQGVSTKGDWPTLPEIYCNQ